MPKMNDAELLAWLEREESAAYGQLSGELAAAREKSLAWYFGDRTEELEAVEGRSKAVDTVISDTIETILPSIVKIFAAGDEVVEFKPVGPEDFEAAEQETAFTNHTLQRQGWLETVYAWVKDGLLCKNAYVEAWWDESEDVREEAYQGLTDDEFALLMQDSAAEITEHAERLVDILDPFGTPMQQVRVHDVRCKQRSTYGCVRIAPVPCEDVLVATSHRSLCLQDAPFVEVRRMVSISSLREAGFDVDDSINDVGMVAGGEDTSSEALVRDRYDEQDMDSDGRGPHRLVLLRKIWARVDRDGDGIAELRRFQIVGRTILEEDTADVVPVAGWSPLPMPHRHVGRSIADLMLEIQAIKSHLWRTALDAQYLAIAGRWLVGDRVNLDDMLVARVGGLVRTQGDPNGAAVPLFSPASGDQNLNMLRYADELGQNRSGISDYFSGTDANAINKTATGITQLMGMAQERVLLIARVLAETGVKDLVLIVHALLRKHSQAPQVFRLRNKWVPVDPRSWRERRDLSVSVGLGTGNRTEMLQHLQLIAQAQQMMLPLGIATPQTLYNTMAELTKNAGFKDVERFWQDPGSQQFQPPPNPMAQAEQAKAQAEAQKMQMQAQLDGQKFQAQSQLDAQRAQLDAQLEQQRLEIERYKAELNAQTQIQIAQMKAEIDLALEREKMALEVARHETGTQLEVARMSQPREDARVRQYEEAEREKASSANLQKALDSLRPTSIEAVRDDMGRMVGSVATYADGSKRQIGVKM